MNTVVERIKNEPVLVTSFVSAALALCVAFGVDLSEAQTGAVMAVVIAALGFVARTQVTPNRAL